MKKQKDSKKNTTNRFAQIREYRYFSEVFRKARVKEIEKGKTTVAEVSRQYEVSSAAIYKWIKKYSVGYQKMVVKVVEPKSITMKLKQHQETISELKQLIAEQQVAIVYYEKLMEIVSEHYDIDFKKNINLPRCSTLEIIRQNLKNQG